MNLSCLVWFLSSSVVNFLPFFLSSCLFFYYFLKAAVSSPSIRYSQRHLWYFSVVCKFPFQVCMYICPVIINSKTKLTFYSIYRNKSPVPLHVYTACFKPKLRLSGFLCPCASLSFIIQYLCKQIYHCNISETLQKRGHLNLTESLTSKSLT